MDRTGFAHAFVSDTALNFADLGKPEVGMIFGFVSIQL